MPPSYADDRQWSDKFIPTLKQIVGYHLLEPGAPEEDMKRNTDLIVLTMSAKRVACRVRRHKYLARYGDEFTIRCDRPNGCETELDKLLAGWGDYLLYGFANAAETTLSRWHWVNLTTFRFWFQDESGRLGVAPGCVQTNGDGSSRFRGFRVASLPAHIVATYNQKEV